MSHPLERADDLAVQAFWFLGQHWLSRLVASDDEDLAALRTAAFRFSHEVHGSEPQIVKARDIANAFLELLSQFRASDSLEKLKTASAAYEQERLRQSQGALPQVADSADDSAFWTLGRAALTTDE
jgi:hypothetical protein